MKRNMGSTDRIIRVMLALVMSYLYYQGIIGGTVGMILLILSVVFVLTSLIGFCPLYLPFEIETCKSDD